MSEAIAIVSVFMGLVQTMVAVTMFLWARRKRHEDQNQLDNQSKSIQIDNGRHNRRAGGSDPIGMVRVLYLHSCRIPI